MMKKTLALLLAVSALGVSSSAMAHGFTKPQHGGVVAMNGETLFELVTAPAGVSLYVIDEDDPVNAAAMTAKLSVTAGGKKTEVMMVPAKGNQFFAKGLKLAKGADVGVLVINKASQARYGTTFIIK
ncbi:MAG TPA: hypothetical protein VF503_00995 [Sphingobium sp.]|uniref:hypothetical protein n=1 Tax=Sphingobium sp. TaxID=1912891 RepID=UPI002ED6B057